MPESSAPSQAASQPDFSSYIPLSEPPRTFGLGQPGVGHDHLTASSAAPTVAHRTGGPRRPCVHPLGRPGPDFEPGRHRPAGNPGFRGRRRHLFAGTEDIADGNGLPISGTGFTTFTWTYQWIRVDGNSETNVGAGSASYHPVEADVGKLIKVRVSFTDGDNFSEAVTSLPFGPIAELAGPSARPLTLVSNTGQSTSATANITQQYAVGFRLGDHGQGYEISSVSIELAAVPSSLTVSLWSGGVEEGLRANTANKLFDFASTSSFAVGLNEFTAPAGAGAYQNVNYFVVLSGFGASLSIKETTSDDEDAGGETGAAIYNNAAVRALSDTGPWGASGSRASVLRLALEGSRRTSGILEQGADYVLAVKQNQRRLYEDLKDLFEEAEKTGFEGVPHDYATTLNKGQGRLEKRECWSISDPECLDYLSTGKEWPGLRSVVKVVGRREAETGITVQPRYFISSLDSSLSNGLNASAEQLLATVRAHWSIENSLHWSLDVTFREDYCRVRKDHGPQNLATLRQVTHNLLKRETSLKVGIQGKRLQAGWREDYLMKVLRG